MRPLVRLGVLSIGLLSLLGLASAAASAVTWENSGATAFTATSGPTTFTVTSAALGCTGSSMTGTAPAIVVGLTYSVTATATFSGCSAGFTIGMDCGYTFTGTSQSGSVASGTTDVTCGLYSFGTKICHLGGTVASTYTNPGTVGVLTFVTGGHLTTGNGPTGTCPLGNGDPVHLAATTYRTTSANPPFITRTA